MFQRGQSHSRSSQEVAMTPQVGQFLLGITCDVFATSQVRQSHLGNSWFVTMRSQIGRFYLGASAMHFAIESLRTIISPDATLGQRT